MKCSANSPTSQSCFVSGLLVLYHPELVVSPCCRNIIAVLLWTLSPLLVFLPVLLWSRWYFFSHKVSVRHAIVYHMQFWIWFGVYVKSFSRTVPVMSIIVHAFCIWFLLFMTPAFHIFTIYAMSWLKCLRLAVRLPRFEVDSDNIKCWQLSLAEHLNEVGMTIPHNLPNHHWETCPEKWYLEHIKDMTVDKQRLLTIKGIEQIKDSAYLNMKISLKHHRHMRKRPTAFGPAGCHFH